MKRFVFAAAIFFSGSSAFALSPFDMPWFNADQPDATYKSTNHPDGVFVLEFFANFCGPCNQNAANVDAMATAYANEERVQVLDIGIDTQDSEIQEWIENHQPNHPVLKDVGRKLWKEFGGSSIPTMAVTDCNGNIKFQSTGVWGTTTKRQIKAAVDALLASSCDPNL